MVKPDLQRPNNRSGFVIAVTFRLATHFPLENGNAAVFPMLHARGPTSGTGQRGHQVLVEGAVRLMVRRENPGLFAWLASVQGTSVTVSETVGMISSLVRLACLVVPGLPHPITRRRNRREGAFFEDGHRRHAPGGRR